MIKMWARKGEGDDRYFATLYNFTTINCWSTPVFDSSFAPLPIAKSVPRNDRSFVS